MLNASVGFQRVIGRLRRPRIVESDPAMMLQTRSLAAARQVRSTIRSVAATARLSSRSHVRTSTPRLATPRYRAHAIRHAARRERAGLLMRFGPDRLVGLAVAFIVLCASVVSVSAGTPGSAAPVGGTTGNGAGPRIAVGGGAGLERGVAIDEVDGSGSDGPATTQNDSAGIDARDSDLLGGAGTDVTTPTVALAGINGPFLDDGTLLKPVAVDTTVEDGSDLLRTYKVKSGDTLTGIAAKFHVSMMTLWWANDLNSKDQLHQGEILTIPPMSGLVLTVTPNDTLDTIAAKYKVDKADIISTNDLTDPTLVVGQVLVVPGAKGAPIPVPKPVKRPVVSRPHSSSGGGTVRPPTKYTGGRFLWPVVGGNNYISQYFHYGHYAIDIAADYGSRVRAAGSGTVIFAGWKTNGGGYQVWIAHGSGLYTTYNHMSAITVAGGQRVGRGQQVGRIGQTGNATGPHLHFEVWRGPVWNGGVRVNPLGYL